MKIRLGFVSNSSSASFIIKFESQLDQSLIESYIKKSDDYVEKEWDSDSKYTFSIGGKEMTNTREAYKKNLKIEDNRYYLTQDTTMFNDWGDINCWKFIRALSENRIKDVKLLEILKTEEEYCDVEIKSEYDPKPWNYDYSEDIEEVNERLEKDNMDYIEYLNRIDQKIDDQETIKIAVYLLKK